MIRGICLCVSLVLILFTAESFSALYRIRDTEDPYHPGLCHLKNSDNTTILLLKPGESKNHPTKCRRVDCSDNFEIVMASCGLMKRPENCVLVKKATDPYPECCGHFECKQK